MQSPQPFVCYTIEGHHLADDTLTCQIGPVSSNGVDQAIQQLSEAAGSLTLDQRLRIAALLAKPAAPEPATPFPNAASSQTTVEALLLTVEEAAELLKVGRTTIYDLMKTGQLNSIMIGRLRRLRRTDMTAYLDQISQASGMSGNRPSQQPAVPGP